MLIGNTVSGVRLPLGEPSPMIAKPGDSGVRRDLFGTGDARGVDGGVLAAVDVSTPEDSAKS